MSLPVSAIVAMDARGGIAREGGLPWHLPEDLKRFRVLTVGDGEQAVLMGRKTWESLPARFRPLPARRNLVMSRQPLTLEGAVGVSSWGEAMAAAAGATALWVIGGAEIYALAEARCPELVLEITHLEADFDCDLFWPGDLSLWEPESESHHANASLTWRYVRYRRGI